MEIARFLLFRSNLPVALARSAVPDDLHALADFARSQRAALTDNKAMSQASGDFASDLLLGRGITCQAETSCEERGICEDLTPFVWTNEMKDASTVQRSEHQATQDVKDWLLKAFGAEFPFYIERVTGEHLPKIDGNHKSATGKSDLCVGYKTDFELYKLNGNSLFEQAMGLIEIKTNQYPLKIPQMQLQIASLSTCSRFKRGVVLMGTDGNSKWAIFHFSQHNTISHRVYSSGRKCLEDFQCLLSSIEDRVKEMNSKRIKLQSIPERVANARGAGMSEVLGSSLVAAPVSGQEQDLCGFEGQLNESRDRAIENELFLRRLAEYLGDLSGGEEYPEVPEWAIARNTCHSYYS